MNPLLRSSAAHVFVASVHDPVLSDEDRHHLATVLRIGPRQIVTISDGAGSWCPARLDGSDLVIDGEVVHDGPVDGAQIAAALPKGDRCEWMVQKLTELGAAAITLVHCQRSVVHWDGPRAAKGLARLRRVAREAAMQSRRTWLPVVEGVVPLTEVIGPGVALAEPGGEAIDVVRPSRVVIGPEGGFTADELASAPATVSLASTVLRVETAALAAVVQLGLIRASG